MKSEILSILALLSKPGKSTSEGKLTWLTVVIIAGSIAAQLLLQANSHEATASSTTAFLGSALALFMTSRVYTSARTQVKASLADFIQNPAISTIIKDWIEPTLTATTSSSGAIFQRIIDAPAVPLKPRIIPTNPADYAALASEARRAHGLPTDAEIAATKAKLEGGYSVESYDRAAGTATVDKFPTKTEAALFVFAQQAKGLFSRHL
jgi:hypothetical protein